MLRSNALLDRPEHVLFGLRPRLPFKLPHYARGRKHISHCLQSSIQGERSTFDVKSCTLFAASLSTLQTLYAT